MRIERRGLAIALVLPPAVASAAKVDPLAVRVVDEIVMDARVRLYEVSQVRAEVACRLCLQVHSSKAAIEDLQMVDLVVATEPLDAHAARRVVRAGPGGAHGKPIGFLTPRAGEPEVARARKRETVAAVWVIDQHTATRVANQNWAARCAHD